METKRMLYSAVVGVALLAAEPVLAGLADIFMQEPETTVTAGQGSPDIQSAQSEAYDGPKARVAVARFTNKTRKHWWTREIGDGMADQLTTALFNTNRFIVLERQTLSDVLAEQDLAAAGRVQRGTEAPIGQIEGAELLVTGAVTEFEADAGGTRGAAGGLVGSVLGAIGGAVQKAHMAIDVRVIDTRTSRILAATSVEGSSTDVDIGGAIGGYFGGGALGGALQSWENTPKEKALRACINQAVEFIVSKTPSTYYHYGSGGARKASYASSSSARTTRSYAAGDGVRVKSAKLNVRSGPGQTNPVAFSVSQGTPLLVQGQQGSWVQVQTEAGQAGWVAGWLIEPDSSVGAADFGPKPAPQAQSAAPSTSSGGGDSLEGRLKKLKSLHEQGLISDQDYERKRDEILQDL